MSERAKCVWIRRRGEPCDEPENNPIHAPCDCEPHVHRRGEEQGFCHPFQPPAAEPERCACCGKPATKFLGGEWRCCDYCADHCRASGPVDTNWYHGVITPAPEPREQRAEGLEERPCKREECKGYAVHDPEFHESEFAPLFPEEFAELTRLRDELARLRAELAAMEQDRNEWRDLTEAEIDRREAAEQRAEAAQEKAHRWETALVGLTVGGSEFAGDPDACVAYVKQQRSSLDALFRESRKRLTEQRERAEAAERRAGEAEDLLEKVAGSKSVLKRWKAVAGNAPERKEAPNGE